MQSSAQVDDDIICLCGEKAQVLEGSLHKRDLANLESIHFILGCNNQYRAQFDNQSLFVQYHDSALVV